MKKGFVSAATLVFLLALAPAYAQATDFFELVMNGTPQSVQAAISQGADVKVTSTEAPLVCALGNKYSPEVIAALLQAGANVNDPNPQCMTPLMSALMNNEPPEVITTLLQAGVDTKAKDSDGKTAFDYAQTNEKLKGTDAYRQLQQASQ